MMYKGRHLSSDSEKTRAYLEMIKEARSMDELDHIKIEAAKSRGITNRGFGEIWAATERKKIREGW